MEAIQEIGLLSRHSIFNFFPSMAWHDLVNYINQDNFAAPILKIMLDLLKKRLFYMMPSS